MEIKMSILILKTKMRNCDSDLLSNEVFNVYP